MPLFQVFRLDREITLSTDPLTKKRFQELRIHPYKVFCLEASTPEEALSFAKEKHPFFRYRLAVAPPYN